MISWRIIVLVFRRRQMGWLQNNQLNMFLLKLKHLDETYRYFSNGRVKLRPQFERAHYVKTEPNRKLIDKYCWIYLKHTFCFQSSCLRRFSSGSVSHESMQRRQEEPFVILLLERFKTSSYLVLNASEISQASRANQDGDIYHEASWMRWRVCHTIFLLLWRPLLEVSLKEL